ncbi:riboflavin synthase subunit alpha [Akkermansia biwaensis]|uniref:Riboflavin synthase n=1 Tax=Akkermansia biwaensis TaxID=2946555 RepID=A0ABN6QFZ5_9BACT|nr:riboflavin synthase subunit alpha [Akkermansia biwaensis]
MVGFTPIDGGARLTLDIPFGSELSLGDSVAVNGCCLTVDALDGNRVSFDLLSQTIRVTSLGNLKPGSLVNLERAMSAMDRFGGHFVMGHVDNTGTIAALEPVGQDHRLEVRIPDELARYCIDKGSITIDGISLTIANLNGTLLEFWITPHTFGRTNLQDAAVGQPVNLEVDMLAKYVEKLFTARESAGI